MGSCDGKVAFITGASRGIGRAIAQRLSAEGASVVLNASRMGAHGKLVGTLEEAVSEIQAAGGKAHAVACDLSKDEARADLIERASEPFGPVDILVNNAAAAVMKLPSQVSAEERRFMYEVNLNAPIDLAQQALPSMRERGQGWILNITSETSRQPAVPYRDSKMAAWVITAYGATKAALDRYSIGLAHEVAEHGIFVNAMGPVAIVLTQGAEYVRDIARKNPDMAEPVEMMAEAALELCTGRHVGQVVSSREILHAVGRPVRNLDATKVLGDAFLEADVEGESA
ncbi:MAG: SDR family NAD(P)-dependent oxidoreductase [Deltaproteobacteria bacterium]|jgi:NAD(P)-dependent dehydrogenase (short-subunit alcohol dehydrogenase family)|nr:SDR family NAD(P)-dependent oxidoreductase [Deltaproteobacteria bacterium]MBW2498769.1 SDR family NAD(P)-dependent oxidoreductase [Deltaproteobacteria bacterium]